MKIQSVVHDVRQRIETAGRHYQGAFKAYVDAQRKALTVVSRNGQSLANTEIGAAKNIYASARASFERARADGVRQLASQPTSYLPSSRPQLIEAYKTTIDLLVKTGNELNDVVWSGYRNVRGQLRGQADVEAKPGTASKSTASPAKKTAARRKTGVASDNIAKASGSKATDKTASKTTTAGKSSAGQKATGVRKSTAKAKTAAANSDSDTGTSQSTDSDA